MEPMLPQTRLGALREMAGGIIADSQKLTGHLHPVTLASMRELVRAMNSYYSNRIEGQGTHPLNIERALHRDFSDKPDVARLQRLALAHIEAEREMEAEASQGGSSLAWARAQSAHRALYSRLSESDRSTAEGRIVQPGTLRTEAVDVGRHVAPAAEALPGFLARFDEVYTRTVSWDEYLVAIACAHQRLAWIHPFLDGNGRAARLQSHAALWPLSAGLWSPSRGLARQRESYYARLSNADAPRRGDLDGRGNLTEAGLFEWCEFFLGVCQDQVSFMAGMLDLGNLKTRLLALITFMAAHDKAIRPAAVLPLHYLLVAGPVARGEFAQMTGLGERVARSLLSRLLVSRLLESDGPYAPVRFGFPLHALQFLLPGLYPEAAAPPD